MRKTIKAAAILAAVVIGSTVAGTAPASASVGDVSYIDMPAQLYYPATGSCVHIPVQVGLASGDFSDTVDSWETSIDVTGITYPDAWGDFDYFFEDAIHDATGSDFHNFSEYMCLDTDSIGKFQVEATTTAYDADFNEVATETISTYFYIGAQGTLSLNASPEPVKKGSTITVTGYFKLAHGQGDGLPNRTIHIWKRLPGSTHWYEVATDKTDSHGKYVVKVKATKTYVWKATYEPTATQAHLLKAKTSASDSVKVK